MRRDFVANASHELRTPLTAIQGFADTLARSKVDPEQLSQYLDVIVRRFGLRGHDVTTLEEVGKAIGLTRERVRQIQVDALRELKAQLAAEGFEQGAVI
jgi:DNA-directed RNA polymerase sigma subunit (sigma70/sigma32)